MFLISRQFPPAVDKPLMNDNYISEETMLIIEGFFENGIFVPEKPMANIKGRQRAVLNIEDTGQDENQNRINAWREFSHIISTSNEILEGEPEKINFRSPDELQAL